MSKLSDRLRAIADVHGALSPAATYEAADAVDALEAALEEARDALNGAPNTVGLHNQIARAVAKLEGR